MTHPIAVTIERKAQKRGGWNRYAIRPAGSDEVIGYLESARTATGRKFWDVATLDPNLEVTAPGLGLDLTPAQARKAVRCRTR